MLVRRCIRRVISAMYGNRHYKAAFCQHSTASNPVTGKFGPGKFCPSEFGPGEFCPSEFGPGEFGPKYKC